MLWTQSPGGLGDGGLYCFSSLLVPVSCLHSVLTLTYARVCALLAQTLEHSPLCLRSPGFQKHPQLCVAKLTVAFRVRGEAGGAVPSIMEDEADLSCRPSVLVRLLRPSHQGLLEGLHCSLGFSPVAMLSFFPFSPRLHFPSQTAETQILLPLLQNNFGRLGLSPRPS